MARQAQKADILTTDDTPAISPAVVTRRRIAGVCWLLLAVVALLALVTYDWRDIPWLSNPPTTVNRMGQLGAWMTFFGYGIGGLAYRYFAVPLMVVLAGFLLHGRVRYFRLRVVWMTLLYGVLASLFQTYGGDDGAGVPLLVDLNLLPNAGGAIGQWLITDLLRPLLGTLGVQLLFLPLAIFLVVLVIGVRNCVLLVVRLAALRQPVSHEEAEEDIRETLRRASKQPRKLTAGPKLPGFFARLFAQHHADVAQEEDVRDVLRDAAKYRKAEPATPEAQAWRPSREPADEPLFARQTKPAPEPPPAPREEVLTLKADDTPVLKPVSPLNTATAPTPTAHDNDTDAAPDFVDYGLPSTDLLDPIPPRSADSDDVERSVMAIESVFQQFGIAASVVGQVRGPVLTQFEIKPEPGVKVEKFKSYERNLLMALRAESIRIQAPIPGRDVVGIEMPNTVRQSVTLREILEGEVWREAEQRMALPLALGKLATGGDLVVDLAEMPHLLVAGGTGAGKSVAVNDMLVGLLMCRRPEQMRLLMVDPKCVEFTAYDDLPHLLNPVVVDSKKVLFSLRWAVVEMNRRYKLLQRYGVRSIADLNKRVDNPVSHRDNPTAKLPYIVIVIDELAELMLTVKADIEPPITSLTQKARAAGIHLIIATQRPTTDIVTGTIKANIPGRIALRVAQSNDSRTILDEVGAENLIGKGDMLLARSGKPTVRSQAAWVSDGEIGRICDFIKEQAGPAFDHVLAGHMERIQEDRPSDDISAILPDFIPAAAEPEGEINLGPEDDKSDEGYYQRALEYIRQTGRFSTSALQRRLKIGYNKAGRITDMLEERGIIGPGGKVGGSREILVDLNAMERAELAGTDGEDAVPDTRTYPDLERGEAVDPGAADYTYEPTEEAYRAPSTEDDFDLGDLDPASLDLPTSMIHPKAHD